MMETKIEHYCRSASLYLCPHISCLQFVFRKLKATGHPMCVCLNYGYMLCVHLHVWFHAVLVFVCLIIYLSVLMTQDLDQDVESYFNEVLATVEQSTDGNRSEQGQIRQKLQQLYSQILCDTNKGALKKSFILSYSILFPYSYLCLTNTNQHSWHTPSVPKKLFFSKKRPGYFVIFSSFLISDVLPDQEAGFVCGVIVTVLGFRSIVQRFLVRCSTSQSGDEFPSVVGGGGALWVGFIY